MIVEQGGIEGVAVRDTAVTARHSYVCAPACLFCVDPSGRRSRGVTVIHVRQDAWIWLRLDPQAGVTRPFGSLAMDQMDPVDCPRDA